VIATVAGLRRTGAYFVTDLTQEQAWVHLDYLGRVLWCPGWVGSSLSDADRTVRNDMDPFVDIGCAMGFAGIIFSDINPVTSGLSDYATGPDGGEGRWRKCTRREALDILSIKFQEALGYFGEVG